MNYAIVTAAGKGTRFGSNKAFHLLRNKPLLAWSLSIFQNSHSIDGIVVAIPPGLEQTPYTRMCEEEGFTKVCFVAGGETRFDSVRNAFLSLKQSDGMVLIHDAARPLVSADLVQRILEGTEKYGAVIPVLAVSDTVKEVEGDCILQTLPREKLFLAQTPQGFQYKILSTAYSKINPQIVGRASLPATIKDSSITDEAMLVETAGFKVHVVKGERKNIKITEASDIRIAECYL